MLKKMFGEPMRDAELATALRAGGADLTPDGDDALRARIVRAAAPRLAARRAVPQPWWQWTAAWARFAVPVGVAASVASGLLLARGAGSTYAGVAGTDTLTESAAVLSAAGLSARSGNVGDQFLAPVSDEWLLASVFGR